VQLATAASSALRAAPSQDRIVTMLRSKCQAVAAEIVADAQYRLGRFEAAEEAGRAVLAGRQQWVSASVIDRFDLAEYTVPLVLAVARNGRRAQAATLLAPVLQFLREEAPRNHGNPWVPVELAQALTDNLGSQLRPLPVVRELRRRILEAQQNPRL
jgi:hypothetical protein